MVKLKKLFVLGFTFIFALIACEKDDLKSNKALITSFTLSDFSATISGSLITLSVPYGTDISNLSPTIQNSVASTITPAAGTARDFGSPVTYTVTAEDGKTTNSYTVTVTVLDPDAVAISSFTIAESESVDIDESAKTITVNVFEGIEVSSLATDITTIPADAKLSQGGGDSTLDLRSPVKITVSAGSKSETYTVSINFLAIGFDADNPVTLIDAGAASNSLPSELSESKDEERGFSINSEYVYVADKAQSVIHYWKLDGSSAAASQLKNTDIVSGGLFTLADVVASEEHGILASNMDLGGNDFKVYRWKDNDADPELILSYPTKDRGKNIRLGDNINYFEEDDYGYLLAFAFPPNNNFVLIWEMEEGVITNADNPRRIDFTELNGAGNYGYAELVEDAFDNYILINGAEITPTLYSLEGDQLTFLDSDAIDVRTFGGKIFDFNQKRYLALATAGTEGANRRDASILVYDVSGESLVEAFNGINADDAESKLVFTSAFGQNTNGNQAADVDVFVDPSGDYVLLMAGATNNGFKVVQLTKAQ